MKKINKKNPYYETRNDQLSNSNKRFISENVRKVKGQNYTIISIRNIVDKILKKFPTGWVPIK